MSCKYEPIARLNLKSAYFSHNIAEMAYYTRLAVIIMAISRAARCATVQNAVFNVTVGVDGQGYLTVDSLMLYSGETQYWRSA